MNSCKKGAGAIALVLLNTSRLAAGETAACNGADDPATMRQAEQKIVLLERLVGNTDPVQRVVNSGNAEAQRALAGARSAAGKAGDALDAGCSAAAIEHATTGLGLASQAFALARNVQPDAAEQYRLALGRAQSFIATLEAQPADVRGMGDADLVGMHRQIERAEELAVNSRYESAVSLLAPVSDRLERRLVAIYDRTTVYYEKSFAGPADEYAYLAQQFEGYELLFERFAADREPPHSAKQRYDTLRSSAGELAREADRRAGEAEWDAAIAAMEDAISRSEQAMRLIGIGY